ncbi:MAG: hypothetical protein LBT43_06035 [Prevotella sp.]|jgi:hypothetical protein|nr:hypothetical protein [Prevotella sp.]
MKKFNVLFLLMLIPLGMSAQSDEAVKGALEFMEGGSIIEDWFMTEFMEGFRDVLMKNSSMYVDIAKALGGCFAIIYFSMQAWNMMTGDKDLKIMPLLKPFGIVMLILNWGAFISIVDAPFKALAEMGEEQYVKTVQENRNLRLSRYQYQMRLADSLAEMEADNEIASETAQKSFMEKAWDNTGGKAIDLVVKPIYAFKAKIATSIQLIVTQLLELCALWILRIMVYLIFSLQMIFTAILVFLGPISVAFSILPMFSNAFKYWLARYISVQFYLVCAFLVLFVCANLQKAALMQEIDRYSNLIKIDGTGADLEKIAWFQANGILSFGVVIVAFLVSAIAICAVPKISSWIIPTAGTSGIVSGMSRAASGAVSKGAGMIM